MTQGQLRRRIYTRVWILLVLVAALGIVGGAVFLTMNMDAISVGVSSPKVIFVLGTDSTEAGAAIGTNSTYLQYTSLSGWPNATRVYEDSAGIRNDEAALAHDIELKYDSWSGDTSEVDLIYVKLYDGSTQKGSTIDVGTPGSSTGEVSLPADTTWRIQWEIRWIAGATSGSSVDISFSLIVK